MASIAVVGPGSIGGVVGALLGKSGTHEVILCSRRPLPGFCVETPSGLIEVRSRVLTDPKEAPPVDWIVVATKAYDAAGAAAWFPGLGGRGARAAILQNGVEHRERFLPFLPSERIVPVVVDCPVERREPTRIRQRGTCRLTAGADAAGRDFFGLLSGSGIEGVLTEDFTTAAWEKLCVNAPGILPALLLRPSGIFRDEGIANAGRDIIRECVAVGRAEGAALQDAFVGEVIARYRRPPYDSINSLHADRLAGRPMETDARNGAVVRFGLKHGIPTPCNRMALVLLEAMAGNVTG